MASGEGRIPVVRSPERVAFDTGPLTFGVRALLGVALVAVVVDLEIYVVAVRTIAGQRLDAELFGRFQHVPGGASSTAIRNTIPALLAVALAALAAYGLWRRRWTTVVAHTLAVAVTLASAEVLKQVLARPYYGTFAYTQNTFPSGHMAFSAALAFAVLALWPRRPSRVVIGGTAAVLAVEALYNVVGFAHRPSDVLGALLLAVAVAACAAAVVAATRRQSALLA